MKLLLLNFRQHLSSKQCVDFDKAWDDYCDKRDNSKPYFIVYAEPDGVTDKIKSSKSFTLKNDHLLKFAEHKINLT